MKRFVLIWLLIPVFFGARAQSLLFDGGADGSSVSVGVQYRDEDQAYLPQEGSGLLEGRFQASTRRRIGDATAVQGAVSYDNGVKRGVLWNTTSDWALLSPYVTADSVGGDLRREQYRFMGRIAHRKGDWFFEAGASYRALHEYRQVDPRPRNIVSDLTPFLSGGRVAGDYALSLTARYRRYHQSQQTSFMNPKGANTSLLHFNGLGSVFGRFTGTSEYAGVRYRGNGFSVTALLEPLRAEGGWNASATYSLFHVSRHLTSQNEVPISRAITQEFQVLGGWNNARLRVELGGKYALTRGLEAVIGNFKTGEYAVELELPQYARPSFDVFARASYGWSQWELSGTLGLDGMDASVQYPYRRLQTEAAYAKLSAAWKYASGRWKLRLSPEIGGRCGVASALTLPETEAEIAALYRYLHARWSGSSLSPALQGKVSYRGWFLSGKAGMAFYTGGYREIRAEMAIGVDF